MGRVVVDLLGRHRAHDADVVGDLADVGKQLGEVLAGLAVALERMLRTENPELLALQLRDLLVLGERLRHGLAIATGKLGLVVEELQVGRSTRHAQEDHPLDLCRAVRIARHAGRGSEEIRSEELRQAQAAQAHGGPAEERSTIQDAIYCGLHVIQLLILHHEFVLVHQRSRHRSPRSDLGFRE